MIDCKADIVWPRSECRITAEKFLERHRWNPEKNNPGRWIAKVGVQIEDNDPLEMLPRGEEREREATN